MWIKAGNKGEILINLIKEDIYSSDGNDGDWKIPQVEGDNKGSISQEWWEWFINIFEKWIYKRMVKYFRDGDDRYSEGSMFNKWNSK